jgi:hypothetical protein
MKVLVISDHHNSAGLLTLSQPRAQSRALLEYGTTPPPLRGIGEIVLHNLYRFQKS